MPAKYCEARDKRGTLLGYHDTESGWTVPCKPTGEIANPDTRLGRECQEWLDAGNKPDPMPEADLTPGVEQPV